MNAFNFDTVNCIRCGRIGSDAIQLNVYSFELGKCLPSYQKDIHTILPASLYSIRIEKKEEKEEEEADAAVVV